MKSYLELVPISAKVHRKQSRMSVFCIVLAVFLVTTIFGMADMFIRSQILLEQQKEGKWHIAVITIGEEERAQISDRTDVKNISRYVDLNFRGDLGYTLSDRDVIIYGSDKSWADMLVDFIAEGSFPQNEKEALVTESVKVLMGLQIGDTVTVDAPDGAKFTYTISGFYKNVARTMTEDMYGIFVTIEAFCAIVPDEEFDIPVFIEFSSGTNVQRAVNDVKEQFGLTDKEVVENTKLLGLIGQSYDSFMMHIYAAAAILLVLVLSAGVMMIASSLNSNVAQRTEFFGLMRCIGATPKQVMRLVYREALRWCRFAIPAGVGAGIIVINILCALLRYLSPQYFSAMPVFGVSAPSVMAGIVVGILTVTLASRAPAKKAAKVSPLAAVSGNATIKQPVRKAANMMFFKVDTALGIHHAKASRKNFMLMTGSFAFSVILFLSFSVTVTFMRHSLTPMSPWTPDLSITSPDLSCSVDSAFLEELKENENVRAVYGRMAAYNIHATVNDTQSSIDLISYEERQFDWSKKYVREGSLETARSEAGTGLIVYEPLNTIQVGDKVKMDIGGRPVEIMIVGVVSDCPLHNAEDVGVIICSEDTFRQITGQSDYTVIEVQMAINATDEDVNAIRQMAGAGFTFSDKRMGNNSVKGTYYCFGLFIYGFLVVIALITIFNVINSIAMSVSARTRLYGAFRAIGLSTRQLSKMVIAEAFVYTVVGSCVGSVLGLICNRLLFGMLVNYKWGDAWRIPWSALGVILLIVVLSVVLAVKGPIQKIRSMSVVDTISAQ